MANAGNKNSLSGTWDSQLIHQLAAPLRAQVLKALRDAILNYDLKPGQKLVERELMENLGVSRTTIREALRELTSEGLVTIFPHKGSFVSKPSLDDAKDLYEVRATLEAVVVGHFVKRATAAEVKLLGETVTKLERVAEQTKDIREILRAKDEFYVVLIQGARSAALKQILEGIQARVQVLRATSLSNPGRPKETIKELRAIVSAIKKRDADTASRLCAEHVRKASITALAHLQDSDELEISDLFNKAEKARTVKKSPLKKER